MTSVHPVYDKRTLTQILARQGITFPSDFLDNPKKSDTFSFFKLLLYLVLGFDVTLSSKEELRVFLAEHKLKVSRGTLKSHLPVVQHFPVAKYVPDEGERLLTGISILMTFRYLQQFGNICGVTDITLSDLLKPTSERVCLLASAAVDYIRFQETYMPDALRKWQESERDRAEIETLQEEIKEYQNAEQQINETLATKENELNRLRIEKNKTTLTLKQMGEKWVAVKEELNAVTRQQDIVKNSIAENIETIHSLEKELENLKGQIVESSETIKETLDAIKLSVQEEEEKLKAYLERIPLLQARIQIYQVFSSRLKESENILRLLEVLNTEFRTSQKELFEVDEIFQETKTKYTQLTKEFTELRVEEENLKQMETSLTEKIAQVENKLHTIVTENKKDAHSKKQELDALQEENEALKSQLPQLERDILLMEEKCETLEEDANRLLAQIQSRLHNLCRQIHAEFQISESMIGSTEQDTHPFKDILTLVQSDSLSATSLLKND